MFKFLNIDGNSNLDKLSVENREQIKDIYKKKPLSFVPNKGQVDEKVCYHIRGSGYSIFFTPEAAVFSFIEKPKIEKKFDEENVFDRRRERFLKEEEQQAKGVAVYLRYLDANPDVRIKGRCEGTGKVNYFKGNDPKKWISNLSSFEEIEYKELWPGIDLVFRAVNGQLKYDFIVQPGARVEDIRLAYDGADSVTLDETGNLSIKTALGNLIDERPTAYQQIGEKNIDVECDFILEQDKDSENVFGFRVNDSYNTHVPLTIDPGLEYSTFLGEGDYDNGYGIAVDDLGNAYVTGFTFSTDFPTTTGAYDQSYNGDGDVFITKLDTTGSNLIYSTFLGGNYHDQGNGIAVDDLGNAYVTGSTFSTDFPTTPGAYNTSHNGGFDVFVTKLNNTGSSLIYSTFLGGSDFDEGNGIAMDGSGNAYVTGITDSTDFPTTTGAYNTGHNGGYDVFVTKLNSTGSSLIYSTFLGGSEFDEGNGIAVDDLRNAYVTGSTFSTDFPTTPGAYDTGHSGGLDVFVTKLDSTGSSLSYSTFLGGSYSDKGNGIAVDGSENAYVTGITDSTDFPTTPGAYNTEKHNWESDVFVTKLNSTGSSLSYSTFLGGSDLDEGNGIALDGSGNAYVTGITYSTDFPTTTGAYNTGHNGKLDVFVTRLNSTGSSLSYSTFLGGSEFDYGNGIAVDDLGNAYVTGHTDSPDFPTTPGAYDQSYNGYGDVFVTKIATEIKPPPGYTRVFIHYFNDRICRD